MNMFGTTLWCPLQVNKCLLVYRFTNLQNANAKDNNCLLLQSSSVPQACLTLLTPWTAARQAFLSITNSWSFLKLKSIQSVMPPNHFILCPPFLLVPSIFPSIRVFSNESTLHIRWPKYRSFSISPFNDYSGLIFKMDWLDLLAVQGTLKSLLQQGLSCITKNLHCGIWER